MEGKGLILFLGVESVLFGSAKESRGWGDILEVTSSLVITLMRENPYAPTETATQRCVLLLLGEGYCLAQYRLLYHIVSLLVGLTVFAARYLV